MCSIYGALALEGSRVDPSILNRIKEAASDRGRDGGRMEEYELFGGKQLFLGNWRATPTPESEVGPLQPYAGMVHNGTISNDKELGAQPGEIDSQVLARILDRSSVTALVESLTRVKGSYALAVRAPRTCYLATNYKPLYYWSTDQGDTTYFSSMERHFHNVLPFGQAPVPVLPYTAIDLVTQQVVDIPRNWNNRALVICSGGLDSTTAAVKLQHEGHDVTLLHFRYGCKATRPEVGSVAALSIALECDFVVLDLPYRGLMGSSNLLSSDDSISGPVEGAEYAHEWVPARNLVMVATAIAYAEAKGYSVVALGNNLEEAGAYPDNEEEFTHLLDRVAPYAVQNSVGIRVLSPVGNLMKHEIVKLGASLKVPYELTWSCYRAGSKHCGECGPCFMRREAFRRAGLEDPVFTQEETPVERPTGVSRTGVETPIVS